MRRRGGFGASCVFRGIRAGAQEPNLRDDAALRALKEGQSPAGGLGDGNGNGNGNGSAHYGRNSTPRTGDNMNDAYVYLMGLYIAGMLAYFLKKRNS